MSRLGIVPAAPTLTWEKSSMGIAQAQAAAFFAPLAQLPREDGTVTGTACSSGYQQGESDDPSTSSTPAITFLIQEVRQGQRERQGFQGVKGAGRGAMLMLSWEVGGQSLAKRVSSRYVPAQRAAGKRRQGWAACSKGHFYRLSTHWAVTPSSAAGSDLRGPFSSGP